MLVPALGVVSEIYQDEVGEEVAAEAFGLRLDEDLDFAMNQFNRRVERIKRARGQTLEQIYQVAEGEEVAG